MIETKSRYTEEAGNLKLNEMTITVDGEGGTTPTTESTAKPTETTTTQSTTKPTESTTVTTAKPDTNADVVFDFGSYKAKAGDKVNVNVMVDTKGQGVAAMDVVFKADSAIKITGIAKESPAFEKSVMTNMDILGANFTAIENGSGDPVKPEDGEAVFVIATEIAADAKDGVYKIGFGDKCEVFKDATKNKFTTAAINGDITVGNPTPDDGTTKPTETTTTQTTKPTTTTTVDTSKADVVFDFGSYKAKAGDKVNVNVMVDTKGQGVAAMDVVFKADSALKITGIAKESPAFEKSVMTNMDILGANFTAIENGSGDPVKPEDGEAVFVIAVEVAADAKDGVYKIGFGDKCEVFKDATKNKFSTAAINGDITVGDPTPTTESTKVTESTETTKTTESTSKSTETTSKSTDTTTSSTSNLTPKYGDVNCDGEVNVADVVLLNKWLNNNADYAITEQGKVNADADLTDDKGITLADSEAILKSIVHLVELPVKK
jgi:outer membrane protein OmpA-like peptidoglycan-associated protein